MSYVLSAGDSGHRGKTGIYAPSEVYTHTHSYTSMDVYEYIHMHIFKIEFYTLQWLPCIGSIPHPKFKIHPDVETNNISTRESHILKLLHKKE